MRIRIPSMLRSYTNGEKYVSARGQTIDEVLNELNKHYPGIKFRFIDELEMIRPHMRLFLNKILITNLNTRVSDKDELFITQALSGGKY